MHPKVYVKPIRAKRDNVRDISQEAHQSVNVAHDVFLKMHIPEAQVFSQSAGTWMLLYLGGNDSEDTDMQHHGQQPNVRPPRVLSDVQNKMNGAPGKMKASPPHLELNEGQLGRRVPPPPAVSPEHSPEALAGGNQRVPPPPWFADGPGYPQGQSPGGAPPPLVPFGPPKGAPGMGGGDLPPRVPPHGVPLMMAPRMQNGPNIPPDARERDRFGIPGLCVIPPQQDDHVQGGYPLRPDQQNPPERVQASPQRVQSPLTNTQQALGQMLGNLPKPDEEFAMYFRWFITRYRWLFIRGKATELKEILGENGKREVADGVIRGDGDLQALRDVFKKDKTHFPADPSSYVAEESSELYKLAKQRLQLHRHRVIGVHAAPTMLGVYYSGHGLPETGSLVFGDRELSLVEVLPIIGGVCACIVFDSCFSGASMLGLMRAWESVQKSRSYKNYKTGQWTGDKTPENCLMEWAVLLANHLLLPTPDLIFEKSQVRVSPPTGTTPRFLRGLIHDFLLQDNLYPLLIVLGSTSKQKQAKQSEAGGLFTLWLTGHIDADMPLPTVPNGHVHNVREQEPCLFALALPRDMLTGTVNLG